MLDENGFKKKTYADLIEDMNDRAKELFGEKINLTPRSFLGILIRLFAWFLSLLWEVAEKVYNSRFIMKSEGISLDRKAWEFGISRNLEQQARGIIQINGPPNFFMEEGTSMETENGTIFELMEDVTLDSNGYGSGNIICVDYGIQGNVAANTITFLTNPGTEEITITNPEPTYGGRERESDAEFKQRYVEVLPGLGSSNTDAIRAELLKISDVRAAVVIENDKSEPDSAGRPPKSISAYVLGGNDDEIAQAIFKKKTAGIQAYGSTNVTVLDLGGYPHEIGFSRATEVPLSVNLSIKKNDSFQTDGESQIKTWIVQYIGGEDSDGSFYAGLNMGAPVIYSKLIKQIYNVDGIEDVDLQIGIKGQALGISNINVNINEAAQISYSDIEVLFL